MKKRIHINQHVIRANAKNGTNDPAITVKTYKDSTYAHRVEIDGPSSVVYSPDKPLNCGARVWVETDASVTLHGLDKEKFTLIRDRMVIA
mgnify:FL=1|tara:strand:- start:19 stop:288 length:270 start_codon:yes stop_codon:yes gene_type:complete